MQVDKPRVDVVIPHFNQADYIESAIESVLRQTLSPHSIIVVDDGSTDPRVAAVLDVIEAHKGIRVIHQENRHVAAARNTGISASDSPYVFVMDGDDRVEETFLEECVTILERHADVGVVSSWIQTFGIGEWLIKPQGGSVENFLHRNNCPGQAVFRRECWAGVGGYKEYLKGNFEDWEFYLSITENSWVVRIIEKPLLMYRVQELSVNTQSQKRRVENYKRIIELHENTFREHIVSVLLKKEEQIVEKFAVIEHLVLQDRGLELPEATFGDGGMAFQIAVENLRIKSSG